MWMHLVRAVLRPVPFGNAQEVCYLGGLVFDTTCQDGVERVTRIRAS